MWKTSIKQNLNRSKI